MQTEIMSVTGMTCGGCVNSVTNVLQAVEGVSDVKVSLAAGQAVVQYDEKKTTASRLNAAVIDAGFGVSTAGASPSPPAKGSCCG